MMDIQIIGKTNANREPAKQMPHPTTERGISIRQQKQGRNGKIMRPFSKSRQRQIQINNPIQRTHPSIAITPSSPVPTKHPIRQMAPNNIEVMQTHVKPKRSMRMRIATSKKHSVAALKLINTHIFLYLSLFLLSLVFNPQIK